MKKLPKILLIAYLSGMMVYFGITRLYVQDAHAADPVGVDYQLLNMPNCASTCSAAYTNNASAASMMVAFCATTDDASKQFSSASYGGVAMTALAGPTQFESTSNYITMFYLIDPADGSNTFAASVNSGTGGGGCAVHTYEYIAQIAPEANCTSNASASTCNLTLTSSLAMVVAGVGATNNISWSPGGGYTERSDGAVSAGRMASEDQKFTSSGAKTANMTCDGSCGEYRLMALGMAQGDPAPENYPHKVNGVTTGEGAKVNGVTVGAATKINGL